MELKEHNKKFREIIKKYNLDSPQKAEEISNYLTKNKHNKISIKEFSELFNIPIKEAEIFLSFIQVGIKFKEKYIDKK